MWRLNTADAAHVSEERIGPMTDLPLPHSVQLAPFRIEPYFDVRVWGYRDLRPWFNRIAGEEPLGEVWLTGDQCTIATGVHAGKTLGKLFAESPEALLGAAVTGNPSPGSPLLIKVIFAREKLSVQVHPDDTMAQKYGEPRGKTECWYTLAAEPGASVALGLKPGVTLQKVKAGIQDGTLEESLELVPVEAGDMVFVDAGTVHAIWPGSILLETQQYSDRTYRMFDYARPRELHIEKSLEATRLTTRAGIVLPKILADRTVLIDVEYFRVEHLPVTGSRASQTLPTAEEDAHGLAYLFAAEGAARIVGAGFEAVELPTRGMVAIPATAPAFVVEDLGGLELIRITPNWPNR
jgi:mannose-6-phosphate isomerase